MGFRVLCLAFRRPTPRPQPPSHVALWDLGFVVSMRYRLLTGCYIRGYMGSPIGVHEGGYWEVSKCRLVTSQ